MRILPATDGSTHAKAATEWLKELPLTGENTVLVLSVAELPQPPTEIRTLRNLRDATLKHARRAAEEAQALLKSCWPAAEVRVGEGDPASEIFRAAEEWEASLVVVGARGLGLAKRFLLGSVSLAVARHARCPVLVVRRKTRSPRRVVVAVDGSDGSLRALEFIAALGLGRDVTIQLVGVVERFRYPSTAPGFLAARLKAALGQLRQERSAQMKKILERGASELQSTVKAVELSVLEGHPAEDIVAALEAQKADLVVVGARGFGPVKRVLLGSVSERVLAHAPCAVLIVRPPAADDQP